MKKKKLNKILKIADVLMFMQRIVHVKKFVYYFIMNMEAWNMEWKIVLVTKES